MRLIAAQEVVAGIFKLSGQVTCNGNGVRSQFARGVKDRTPARERETSDWAGSGVWQRTGFVAAVWAPLAPFGQHAIHDDGCKEQEAQRHHDQDNY